MNAGTWDSHNSVGTKENVSVRRDKTLCACLCVAMCSYVYMWDMLQEEHPFIQIFSDEAAILHGVVHSIHFGMKRLF